ncbi:hypothetical protein T492DRAFT_595754 [Pavlovales sp. CCMP2436]|nr:hypothetical protein T492DRAFT_595754 [Pavlovales sp. CCMP2436]
MPAESAERAPEIEYVSKLEPALKDPAFYEFAKVFEHFSSAEEPANPVASAGADAEGEAKVEGGEEDDDDLDGERGLSRKLKKAARITVAALKRSTEHPEVVEQWDVCASEPELLVHLKAARNAVPVPRHWSQKRAYLQGKRGVEKKPFQLPDFIAATGIEKIRQVVAQKEEAKKLKSRTREATRPKMNRLDLDYQVLHDAFFKYQTKPKMTRHGDVYWEGKENEVHLREKRPGQLSADVRRALGMGDDPLTPPPWLVNMQRYGPPPSYPLLRIPGLNAPLLEGASYGTHPGGWGKPPVDESGSPLYGNPFAPPPAAVGGEGAAAGSGGQEAAGKAWGEADSESEESADEEEEETGAEAEARGTASVSSVETGGTETPMGAMQLRKERPTGVETPSSVAGADTPISATPEPPRALYQVLEQKTNAIGSAAFGSAHTYSLPAPNAAADAAQPSAKAAKRLQGAVDVALDPSELEDLDEETLKRRYEETVNAGKRAAQREDFSDLIEEHEARKRRKQVRAS